MKQLFRGGIHPDDRKALSRGGAPVPMPAPSRVVIPMSQHIGAPCSPLVKVGDAVKLGQKIGDGEGVCSPVHAPVSGTVTAVEQMTVPGGRQCVCVAIENDGKDTPDPSIKPRTTHKGMSAAELADIVREAGICGMGGAAYPTNSKILSTAGKTETLLINACECEPYITSDDTVMCTWPEKVILGARIVADVIGAKHTVIAVEDNKQEAIAAGAASAKLVHKNSIARLKRKSLSLFILRCSLSSGRSLPAGATLPQAPAPGRPVPYTTPAIQLPPPRRTSGRNRPAG